MTFKEEFKTIVRQELSNKSFIGLGNPNAKILVVGKEVSTNPNSDNPLEKQAMYSYENNAYDWQVNIENNIKQSDVKNWIYKENIELNEVDNNPLYTYKGTIKRYTSDTWRNYQKLYDIIFNSGINTDNQKALNFQEQFFISEMSDYPMPKTKDAQRREHFKEQLEKRKHSFFRSDFIQQFPIVVLACSNYIWNKKDDWQINDIFGVKFDIKQKFSQGEYEFSSSNKFWTHYDERGEKLVIHTRQLSNNVKDSMLIEMGELIRGHLAKLQ